MYACICHGVHDHEVNDCIRAGARTEDEIGDACDAGTGCGNCRQRLADMIERYRVRESSPAFRSEVNPGRLPARGPA